LQLIKNGPDIPERLLQAHEDGQVVFFCGAGISYPAGLPSFKGLTESIFSALGPPSDVESSALRNHQYETAIGLLEGRIAGGREAVRHEVAKVLTPNLGRPDAAATHDALVTLSRRRNGQSRLITTNFDRIFEEVITRRGLDIIRCQAPRLPIPKSRWDGLVYLHGLLPAKINQAELDSLVLSSGDFGLAYLIERWAARFVSELFRNFTVCFVGYSINDPVMRYMMDALAADKLLGETPSEVFAFGSHPKGRGEKVAVEWRAKNVTPVLYQEYRSHFYFHKTLHVWAENYRDGTLAKERIIIEHAPNKPAASTKEDDVISRVLWALADMSGFPAKRFAELDPIPPLDWLEVLSHNRFYHRDLLRFGVQPTAHEDNKLNFSLIARPAPYSLAPRMSLIQSEETESRWDEIMFHLARWLLRHLDNPQLVMWIAARGGSVHPQFGQLIRNELDKGKLPVPIAKLWNVVLSGRLRHYGAKMHLGLYHWKMSFVREGLTLALQRELRELLTPRVRLAPKIRLSEEDQNKQGKRVDDFVSWEIVLSADDAHTIFRELRDNPEWRDALPKLLSDASVLLIEALELMRELDGADEFSDRSYFAQPSISLHAQNTDFREWTALIDLVRDAWCATATVMPDRARLEVERWLTFPFPLFRRLAFFAATETSLFPPRQSLDWLLSDDRRWLWSVETERETMRLLVKLAPLLARNDSTRLLRAIVAGPPRNAFREDIEEERFVEVSDREVWLRLAKCKSSGAELGSEFSTRLEELSRSHPTWRLEEDQRDEFPYWMSAGTDWREFQSTPRSRPDLVAWLREHPQTDFWKEDNWSDRCKSDFPRASTALIKLAIEDLWPVARWQSALQIWAEEARVVRSWRWLHETLLGAPLETTKALAHSLSWFLQAAAKKIHGNESDFFALIRKLLLVHRNDALEEADNFVSKAINHPVGQVTDAAFRWWYRQAPQDNQGLNVDVTNVLDNICDLKIAIFRYGRMLLGANAIALFRVDRRWAGEKLLPLFDWNASHDEARGAWMGFLWSPRLYGPLLEVLAPQLVATAQYYMELGDHKRQYAAFLTFIALEGIDSISRKDLIRATATLPSDGLEQVSRTLSQALESAGDRRAEYWRNRILPYIREVWPKSKNVLTPSIANNFARLCIEAGDAFPEGSA
jgi:hypothetical protein